MAMSPSSTVHGGQHDTKYATFELLMHTAFVADEIWGFMLEPARTLRDETHAAITASIYTQAYTPRVGASGYRI